MSTDTTMLSYQRVFDEYFMIRLHRTYHYQHDCFPKNDVCFHKRIPVRIVLPVVHDGALCTINLADLKALSDEISLTIRTVVSMLLSTLNEAW